MRIDLEVTNCEDCPLAKAHRGHGECWTYCSHPNHGRASYEDILYGCNEKFKGTPNWCPLLKENNNQNNLNYAQ